MKIFTRFSFKKKFSFACLGILTFHTFLFAQCPSPKADGTYNPKDDIIITSYHQSIAKTPDGLITWGEDMDSNGGNALTIQEISPANGYNFTGDIVQYAVSGNSGGQAFLLTTTNLYAWGQVNEVVNGSFVSGATFDTMALPAGVSATDVTDLYATSNVLAINTSAGEVWVASVETRVNGNTSTNTAIWQQVQISAGVPITDVFHVSGSDVALYAIQNDGDVYAWGENLHLADGNAAANYDFATLMTAPPSTPTYITAFYNDQSNEHGVLALGTDRRIYGVGFNTSQKLINETTIAVLNWETIDDSFGNPIENVLQISSNQSSEQWASAGAITEGATPTSKRILLTWGSNNQGAIGQGGEATTEYPTIPGGYTVDDDDAVYVSTGGHATTIYNRDTQTICFTGHVIDGSTGGLTGATATNFECITIVDFEVCGVDACVISSIVSSDESVCNNNGTTLNTTDDFFTADITVEFLDIPTTGTLDLTGDGTASVSVVGLTSPHTFDDVVLPANGSAIALTATFSDGSLCFLTNSNIVTAPVSCSFDINAEDDDFSGTPIDSASAGTTASVFNDNGSGTDTADGLDATDGNISDNISITNNGGLIGASINTDGTINIPQGTTSGSYTVEYTICLDIEPTICSTANVTILVFNSCTDGAILGTATANDPDGDGINNVCDLDDDNDGILDTSECTSTPAADADSVDPSSSGLLNQNSAIGSDDIYASLDSVTDELIIDLGLTVNADVVISIESLVTLDLHVMGIEQSIDNVSYSNLQTFNYTSTSSETAQSYTLTSASRYIRITMAVDAGSGRLQIDNIRYQAFCGGDTDDDGMPDYLDTDSDNDGCDDVVEAGHIDTNGDGQVDGTGFDGNGQVTGFATAYTGANADIFSALQVAVDATLLIDQIATEGDAASFTITSATATSTTTFTAGVPDYTIPPATDVSVDLAYQWQRNGTDIDGVIDGGVYSNFNTVTLNISDVTGLDSNVYNLVITHPNNLCINEQNSSVLTVSAAITITAQDDDFTGTPIDSAAGGTTASVFNDNGNGTDTANGIDASDANISDNINITNDGGLTGVTINSDGTIDIPAGTTSGSYTITYQICLDTDPTICDTADVSIDVDPSINAEDDDFTGTPIDSAAGGTTASVFNDNGNGTDTANGIDASDANISDNINITNDGGLTGVTINSDGTIDIPAGTTSGSYTVTYQICLDSDPTICDTADVSIDVDPSINAEDDDFTGTPIDSAAGGTTASVFNDNGNGTDTANGIDASDANISDNINITNDGGLTGVTINSDGTIDIPAGTTSGSYTVTYQICLDSDPTICDTADVSIDVDPSINAEDDDFTGTPIDSAAGGTTASVFNDNGNGTDTANGIDASDANISDNINITNDGGLTGVTINSDGTIDIPAGTTSGSYTITYQICLDTDPTICDTADVSIDVDPSINAEDDDFTGTPIDSAAGGTTASVFSDNGNGTDTANGIDASDANISDNINITNDGGLTGVTINSDGTIDIPAGTTSGSYTITYQICLDTDPTICDTADVSIDVDPSINAEDDDFTGTPIDSAAGGTTASVFNDNGNGTDTANGIDASDANISDNINITNDGGLTGVTINSDGTIDIPAGTTSGSYTVTYQICLDTDPTICDTADVTILVDSIVPLVADVSISKSLVDSSPYETGDIVTYSIVVSNTGPDPANNVVITETPSNLTITGVTGGGCTTFPCTIANIPSGSANDVTITVTATINAAGDFINSASATADETDPDPSNNTDDGTDGNNGGTAAGISDVSITKTLIDSSPYETGDTVTYTLVVSNAGPDTANNVVISDTPTNLGISSVSGGGCSTFPCTIPSIGSGAANDVTITVTGIIVSAGVFTNSTSVFADETDLNMANNIDDGTDGNNDGIAFGPSLISAEDDDFSGTSFNPITGGVTESVFSDNGSGVDTANGVNATNGNISDNIAVTNSGGLIGVTINTDGTINIPVNSAPGVYTVEYQICLESNPVICDVAEVIIVLGACADFPTNDCDADGVINAADICEGFDDALDADGDLVPDGCDDDDDNDGILDTEELGVTTSAPPACGSQTVFDFSAIPTEESGDGILATLLEGEVFRFANVTTGTDALVTLVEFNNARVDILDDNSSNAEYFKPGTRIDYLNPGQEGYVEYNIQLVQTGTLTPVSFPEVFVGFNDMDGSVNSFERNRIPFPINYVVDNPTTLTITAEPNFLVATSGSADFGGSSNSNPFLNITVNYNDFSSYTFRLGVLASNPVIDAVRYHSLLFDCATNYIDPQTTDPDTDDDGIPDFLDSDSDNDGCTDAAESGGTDANNDGILDGTGIDASGLVTGGTGGYDGLTGNEVVATQVVVDATALAGQTVTAGNNTSFTITSATATSTSDYIGTAPNTSPDYSGSSAVDVSSGINYQWYLGDPNSGGTILINNAIYSGVDTDELSISDVTGLNGVQYCLLITHDDNVCIREINCATLTVDSLCSITAITSTNESACNDNGTDMDDSDDFFTADITVTFANAPLTGTLDLTGDGTASVAVGSLDTATSHTFVGVQLPSDGGAIDLTATFSADAGCTFNDTSVTVAPGPCSVVIVCSITAITSTNESACNDNGTDMDDSDDFFTADITVTFANAPLTGTLDLTGDGTASVAVGSLDTATSHTFVGVQLPSDGGAIDLTATFSADAGCTFNDTSVTVAPGPCSVVIVCSITAITSTNESACNDNGTDMDDSDDFFTADITVTFSNAPLTGTLDLTGDGTASVAVGSLDTATSHTFVGVQLPSDGGAIDLTAAFSADAGCTFNDTSVTVAPGPCSVVIVCSITAITSTNESACNDNGTDMDDSDDFFTADITVTFANAPLTGTLDLTGDGTASVAVGSLDTATSHTFVGVQLPSDGGAIDLTATFSADAGCTFNDTSVTVAPGPCSVVIVCSITAITSTNESACNDNGTDMDDSDDFFTADITVTFANAPLTGTLDLTGDGTASVAVGSLDTATSHTFVGVQLPSDGGAIDLTATFSADAGCTFNDTSVTVAPGPCSVVIVCSITAITSTNESACNDNGTDMDDSDDFFTADITVTFANAPLTGTLDLTGDGTASVAVGSLDTATSHTFVGVQLPSDGGAIDLTATFSADAGCTFNDTSVTVAPGPCSVVIVCSITAITSTNESACNDNGTDMDDSDDFFTADITVTFSNAPLTGTLDLTGDGTASVAVGSLDTATSHTFVGVQLPSDGGAIDLTAAFSADAGCAFNDTSVTVAPGPCSVVIVCSITAITSTNESACNDNGTDMDDSDDFFTADITVTFANAPLTGTLDLTGDGTASVAVGSLDTATSHTFVGVQLPSDGGAIDLTATFSADAGCTFNDTSVTVAPGPCNVATNPQIIAEKIATVADNGNGVLGVGDIITYTITVQNTGNVVLDGVGIVDTLTDFNGTLLTLTTGPVFDSANQGSLEGELLVGEIATYVATYIITQNDVNAGGVSNTVLADGDSPDGTNVSDVSDDPNDSENIDPDNDGDPDDPTDTVIESDPCTDGAIPGTVTENDSDGDGLNDICDLDDDNDGLLDEDERGDTTVDQPDCGNHTVLDFSAIATEEIGDGNVATLLEGEVFRFANVTAGTDALVTLVEFQNAIVDLLDDNSSQSSFFKPASRAASLTAGQEAFVEYAIQLVQSGTTTAVSFPEVFINVNDIDGDVNLFERVKIPSPQSFILNNPTNLAVTSEAGNLVINSGNVDFPGSGNEVPENNISARYLNFSTFIFKLGIFANDALIDEVRFHSLQFDCVTNFTGTQTTDPDTDGDGIPDYLDTDSDGDGCPDALEGDGGFTAADLDADDSLGDNIDENGIPIVNGNSGQQNDVSSTDSTVNACDEPGIEVVKIAEITDNGDGIIGIDDIITYTITVKNTGNVTLNNVNIVDTFTDIEGNVLTLVTGPSFDDADQGSAEGTLLAGETATYLATYIITQEDVNVGGVSNSVVAGGDDPDGVTITDTSDDGDDTDGNTEDDPTETLTDSIFEVSVSKEVDSTEPLIGDEVTFTITVANEGFVTATGIVVEEVIPSGYAFIAAVATSGTYSDVDGEWIIGQLNPGQVEVLSITVEVLGFGDYVNTAILDLDDENQNNNSDSATVAPICLTIYNEFSPNGDGVNEFFNIDCIETFPNNTLEIYNRWGNIVYETKGYRNDWDGTSNGRAVLSEGEKLPVGTYYYVIDLGNGSEPRVGWLYINR